MKEQYACIILGIALGIILTVWTLKIYPWLRIMLIIYKDKKRNFLKKYKIKK